MIKYGLIILLIAMTLAQPSIIHAEALKDNIPKSSTVNGELLYQKLCSKCHGEAGIPSEETAALLGIPPTNFSEGNYRWGGDIKDIIVSIRDGRGNNMLRYADRLTKGQIRAVAKYVQSLKR